MENSFTLSSISASAIEDTDGMHFSSSEADNELGSDLPTPASKKRKRFSLTANPRCCYIQDIIQFRLGEAVSCVSCK